MQRHEIEEEKTRFGFLIPHYCKHPYEDLFSDLEDEETAKDCMDFHIHAYHSREAAWDVWDIPSIEAYDDNVFISSKK